MSNDREGNPEQAADIDRIEDDAKMSSSDKASNFGKGEAAGAKTLDAAAVPAGAAELSAKRFDVDVSGVSRAESPASRDEQLVGSIDAVTPTSVQGWARSPGEPQLRLELTLIKGSTPLKTLVANEFREALLDQGEGDGRYGFSFDLEDDPLGVGEHTLSIVSAYTGRHMPGSPFRVEISQPQAAPAPARAIRGYVDAVKDIDVSGWVIDLSDPSRRCMVRLVEGDKTLVRVRAAGFRQDLLDAGIGDGSYAFSLPMPRSLIDGREHSLSVIEEQSGAPIHEIPLKWRSDLGVSTQGLISNELTSNRSEAMQGASLPRGAAGAAGKLTVLIDLSDLVYYIGHHDNLTGIQRVQSSIVLAMANSEGIEDISIAFISYYAPSRKWIVIPYSFMINLLNDLFYANELRRVKFNPQDARNGLLPGSVELEKSNAIHAATPSVLCLLGAAWVQKDYFNRVLALKQKFDTKFVMLVHDLIPIYARETCDQGTALVFESFFSRAMRHVDHYMCVSENTAKDLRGYLTKQRAKIPEITVTRLGGSFGEFISDLTAASPEESEAIPKRFVLFVSTIEGRKNHKFVFDVWRALVERGEDPPALLCVGRVGWKAESFISDLVESNYLDGRVMLLEDISDAQLQRLYDHCMFTVFPSLYEGWGLPVGESLAKGKICVCSDRASIPEVAGEFGVYIDIDDLEASIEVVRNLMNDDGLRSDLEQTIQQRYKSTSWESVARTVLQACGKASQMKWPKPYPFVELPYAFEIGFSSLTRNFDGVFGGDLLARTINARKPHILYEPLSEHSILIGEDARTVGNWAEPEGWGCWLCEGKGDIAVSLPPENSRHYYVFLRIRAAGMVAQSKVRLSVNGDPAWDNAIGDAPRNVVLKVRRKTGDGQSGWLMRLHAEMDLSEEMRSRIAGVDSRIPTIGFERMAVIPENDARARMDALTRMLIDREL